MKLYLFLNCCVVVVMVVVLFVVLVMFDVLVLMCGVLIWGWVFFDGGVGCEEIESMEVEWVCYSLWIIIVVWLFGVYLVEVEVSIIDDKGVKVFECWFLGLWLMIDLLLGCYEVVVCVG